MYRMPFFSPPLERDDDGMRIAKEPVDGRQGLEPGKPINIA
jgi:hypothetical protein